MEKFLVLRGRYEVILYCGVTDLVFGKEGEKSRNLSEAGLLRRFLGIQPLRSNLQNQAQLSRIQKQGRGNLAPHQPFRPRSQTSVKFEPCKQTAA